MPNRVPAQVAQQFVVLVVEDAHWVDSPGITVLHALPDV